LAAAEVSAWKTIGDDQPWPDIAIAIEQIVEDVFAVHFTAGMAELAKQGVTRQRGAEW
jgi:hypothetical protein